MVDYAKALWQPNTNYFPNTGKKSFIILHATAGGSSAQGIASYFQSTEGGPEPVSSHYIVGQDGQVVQTIAEANGAYANGVVNNPNWTSNPNYYTISIEHVKPDDANATPLTDAQKQASFALIKDICQRNGIGMYDADDTTGITSHASIDPVNRARCPGAYPWDELWAYLQKGGNGMLPNGWSDDGQTLKCGNYVVVRGFRAYVLSKLLDGTWRGDDMPCENEHPADPMEYSNTGLKPGTKQRFRYSTLEWNIDKGIFRAYNGPELIKLEQLYLAEKSQNTALTQQLTALQAKYDALQNGSALATIQADMHQIYQIATKYEVKS